jgi:integrase
MHMAKTSVQNDASVLRRFVQAVKDPQVHNLSAEAAEAYFASITDQQASSYNKVLQRVRLFLAFCTRRGWLDTDPVAELRPRKVARKERLRLNANQLRQMLELTANPRDRAVLAAGIGTALRASDICALTVGDLDLDAGYLRATIQKTGDCDQLPITQDLDFEMRRWLTWYAERLAMMGLSLTPDMRLFPSVGPTNSARDDRGRPMFYGHPKPWTEANHPARIVQRALVRIGITSTTQEGLHTLRRSVGRLVFEHASAHGHDSSLRITAALLGHRSVATTELYLGLSLDRAKRDQLLRGKSLLGASDENVVRLVSEA